MSSDDNSPATKGKRARGGDIPPAVKPTEPTAVPAFTRWTLRIGGGAAILCGAILSFFALYGLAVMNGWPRYIAWALPGSVDILTATAAVTAMSVPRAHRGAKIAHWCAGVSLLMTVGCNVEYHALLQTTHWSVGHIFLVATGAVPALVVELILVMQMYLGDGAVLAATGNGAAAVNDTDNADLAGETGNGSDERQTGIPTEAVNDSGNETNKQTDNGDPTPRQTETGNPDNSNPPSRQKPPGKAPAAGQPSTDTWVEIGKPLYDGLRAELGKRPGETKFCAALTERVTELIARGELPDVYAAPSLSTAKRIRGEIEERFPGIIFGHAAEGQSDVAEEVA